MKGRPDRVKPGGPGHRPGRPVGVSVRIDGAVDGMLWLDGAGHILRMNPSISRMFGYAEEQMLGQHNLVLMEHG